MRINPHPIQEANCQSGLACVIRGENLKNRAPAMTKQYWKSLFGETPRMSFLLASILCLGAILSFLVDDDGNRRVERFRVVLLPSAVFFAFEAWRGVVWRDAQKKRKPWLLGIVTLSCLMVVPTLVAHYKRPSRPSNNQLGEYLWAAGKALKKEVFSKEPPLKLDYERRTGTLGFGKTDFLIITNKSDKPVLPSKGELISPDGRRHALMLPRIIKPYESAEVQLRTESGNLLLVATDVVEIMCEDFGKPSRITFQ
jgi:hypothetical protein